MSSKNQELIRKWIKNENAFLVFVGNPGIGKTYTCAAIYNWIRYKNPQDWIRYYPESLILSKLRGAISDGFDYQYEIPQLFDDKWIIIDDIGSTGLDGREWRKEVLNQIIDYRMSNDLPTMLTSNLSEQDFLSMMHPRVHSRVFAKENFILDTDDCIDFRANPISKTVIEQIRSDRQKAEMALKTSERHQKEAIARDGTEDSRGRRITACREAVEFTLGSHYQSVRYDLDEDTWRSEVRWNP